MGKGWLAGVLVLLACGGTTGTSSEPQAPAPPPALHEWKAEVPLDGLLPPGATLAGVAVDGPGRRYVLDGRSGLYELVGATARLVVGNRELAALAGLGLDLELTDVAAGAPGQFIFTAENEGLIFDVEARALAGRFCYFPVNSSPPPADAPSVSQTLRMQGIEAKERTEAVAYDASTRLLYAQPMTTRMDTGAIAGFEVFVFRLPGEQPIQTRRLPDPGGFFAGGMVSSPVRLLMGAGNQLHEMRLLGEPVTVRTFAAPLDITGMARDVDGELLLLDGAGRRLLKISEP